jgi:hypothetical protein
MTVRMMLKPTIKVKSMMITAVSIPNRSPKKLGTGPKIGPMSNSNRTATMAR